MSQLPEAAWTGALERFARFQQCPVEVQADVGLQTIWKPLEHAVHVDPVGVRPGVLREDGYIVSQAPLCQYQGTALSRRYDRRI